MYHSCLKINQTFALVRMEGIGLYYYHVCPKRNIIFGRRRFILNKETNIKKNTYTFYKIYKHIQYVTHNINVEC